VQLFECSSVPILRSNGNFEVSQNDSSFCGADVSTHGSKTGPSGDIWQKVQGTFRAGKNLFLEDEEALRCL
jgi:hypothetical protein